MAVTVMGLIFIGVLPYNIYHIMLVALPLVTLYTYYEQIMCLVIILSYAKIMTLYVCHTI